MSICKVIQSALIDVEAKNLDQNIARQLVDKGLQSYFYQLQKATQAKAEEALVAGKPEAATEALKDLFPNGKPRQITLEHIQATICAHFKLKHDDLIAKKRTRNVVFPRQIAMYLAKELTQKSLPEIGELFGGRDHTTVLHAVRKIAGERQQLTELNQQLHVLEQTLKG